MNPYELPASIQPLPDRTLLIAALNHPDRWTILKELTKGEPRMGIELAELVGKNRDAVAKQMFMLQRAGVVAHQRNRTYSLLKQYLPQPGQPIVDFGHCLLRLNAGA